MGGVIHLIRNQAYMLKVKYGQDLFTYLDCLLNQTTKYC